MKNQLEKLFGSFVLTIVLMTALGLVTLVSTLLLKGGVGRLWQDGSLMNIYQFLYGATTLGIAIYLWNYQPRTEYVIIPTIAIAGLVTMNEYHMPVGLLLPTMIIYLVVVIYWTLSERDHHHGSI